MTAWRLVAMVPLLAGIGLSGPAMAKESAGVEPGAASGGSVVKTGWWWRPHDVTPLDGTVIDAPDPTAPNVPDGALPVSAVGGEPEKASAIEFKLEAEPGALVESFTLVLRESAEPGANVNQEAAKVVACPVTEAFWAAGDGARWSGMPKHDCTLARAPGQRSAKGVWSFDLTSIAQGWLTAGSTNAPAVVLVEDAEPPEGFHVSFDGIAAEGIGFEAVTSAAVAPPAGSPGDGSGGDAPAGSVGGTGGNGVSGSVGGSVGGSTGGTTGFSSPSTGTGSLDTGSLPAADVPVTASSTEAPAAAPAAAPATTPVAAPAGPQPWYSGIPGAGYLLLPFALGLAYLAMLALGPDAQPAAANTTQRGVGRALEKLRHAGAHVATRKARA